MGTDRRRMSPLVPFGEYGGLPARKLRRETCEKYGYFIGEYDGTVAGKPYKGRVQVAPYHDAKGRIVAQKVRTADKRFTITGDIGEAVLFGRQLWKSGGKRVVVTEGEVDCLSVAQALGLTWPVVSIPNGAAGARKSLANNLEWLDSYDLVVLMFDNDEPGKKAAADCTDLFTPGKCLVASLPLKDPNEMLQEGRIKELVTAVWEAQERRPDGVVRGKDLWERVQAPVELGCPFPWKGLNDLTYGMSPSELVVFTAGSGVGKSAVTAEVLHNLAIEQKKTCGVLMLEESVERSARRFMGIALNQPLHLPTNTATEEDLRRAFDATLGTDHLHFLDHFGSLDEEVLLSRLRYMAKGLKCSHILLDHVSLVASGANLDTDERRFLDHLMTSLRSFTQETGTTLLVVSHLKRPDGNKGHEEGAQTTLAQLRGSAAIGQLADTVIGLERNGQAESEGERNTTTVRVLKARRTGTTGPAGELIYNRSTGRLSEVNPSSLMTEGFSTEESPF